MTQLSPNFTLAEMCKTSHTQYSNHPGPKEVEALKELCVNVLEKVRAHFGQPVIVTSAYRSPLVNAAAGSKSKSSQHILGEAADIKVKGVPNADVWHFITTKLAYDQCIAELLSETNPATGWVHVSYRKGRLRHDAKSFIGRGVYVQGLKYAS